MISVLYTLACGAADHTELVMFYTSDTSWNDVSDNMPPAISMAIIIYTVVGN